MDSQLLLAVQSIAQSLQSHWWPPTLSDLFQVALIMLTAFTVVYLRRYTKETIELRRATRDQVEVNNQVLGETKKLRIATQEQVIATTLLLQEERKQTDAAIEQGASSNRLLREAQVQNERSIKPLVCLVEGDIHFQLEYDGKYWNIPSYDLQSIGSGHSFNINVCVYSRSWRGDGRSILRIPLLNANFVKRQVLEVPLKATLTSFDYVTPLQILTMYRNEAGKLYGTLQRFSFDNTNSLESEFVRTGVCNEETGEILVNDPKPVERDA